MFKVSVDDAGVEDDIVSQVAFEHHDLGGWVVIIDHPRECGQGKHDADVSDLDEGRHERPCKEQPAGVSGLRHEVRQHTAQAIIDAHHVRGVVPSVKGQDGLMALNVLFGERPIEGPGHAPGGGVFLMGGTTHERISQAKKGAVVGLEISDAESFDVFSPESSSVK